MKFARLAGTSVALIAGLAGLLMPLATLHAQTAARGKPLAITPPNDVAPSAPVPEPLPPPYEPQLMRLAEIMGTLAFMRELCGDKDGAEWNGRMKALMDTEAKTDARRERLAGAYNRGFRGYEVIYRVCTPAAQLVITRLIAEGGRLAHEISYRFSG